MTNNKKVKAIIQRMVEKIRREYQPEKIILYGSYSYGKPTLESDIDLFIIKESDKRRIDRFCEVRRIIRGIKGISVQPVVFTKKEVAEKLKTGNIFFKEILEKGKVLYG